MDFTVDNPSDAAFGTCAVGTTGNCLIDNDGAVVTFKAAQAPPGMCLFSDPTSGPIYFDYLDMNGALMTATGPAAGTNEGASDTFTLSCLADGTVQAIFTDFSGPTVEAPINNVVNIHC